MRAQALAEAIPLEADLETLDRYLTSDHSPPDCMQLSELDGLLTGLAIGPEVVQPSEWLELVWGGEVPEFRNKAECERVIAAIMARYNEIARTVEDKTFAPVVWADRDDTVIASDWAQGFLHAILLRLDAWDALLKSERNQAMLVPMLVLCGDEKGESLLGLSPEQEDAIMQEATRFIPACVFAIAGYWLQKGAKQISMPLTAAPSSSGQLSSSKVGRNAPCPCGSGKKFKKCCGGS